MTQVTNLLKSRIDQTEINDYIRQQKKYIDIDIDIDHNIEKIYKISDIKNS